MIRDFQKMVRSVEACQVLGLGEAVHASPDLHRLIAFTAKYLIENHGFSTILLENPTGPTSMFVKDMNQDHLYKIWRTNPFLEFLSWLREFAYKNLERKIRLVGFDIRQVDLDYIKIYETADSFWREKIGRLYVFQNLADWKLLEVKCLDGNKSLQSSLRRDREVLTRIVEDGKNLASDALLRVLYWYDYVTIAKADYGKSLQIRDRLMYRQAVHKISKRRKTIIIGHSAHLFKETTGAQSSIYKFNLGPMMGELIGKKYLDGYKMIHFTGANFKSIDFNEDKLVQLSPFPNTLEFELSSRFKFSRSFSAEKVANIFKNFHNKKIYDLSNFYSLHKKPRESVDSVFAFKNIEPHPYDQLVFYQS